MKLRNLSLTRDEWCSSLGRKGLAVCRIDGCAVGYRDLDFGCWYFKPVVIVTSMDVHADALRSRRCCCCPSRANSCIDRTHKVPGHCKSQTGLNIVATSIRQFPVYDTHHEPASSLRSSRTVTPRVLRVGTYLRFQNPVTEESVFFAFNLMNPPPSSLMDSVQHSLMHLLPYSVMGSQQMPKCQRQNQNRQINFLSIQMVKELEMLTPEIFLSSSKQKETGDAPGCKLIP